MQLSACRRPDLPSNTRTRSTAIGSASKRGANSGAFANTLSKGGKSSNKILLEEGWQEEEA